MHNLPTASGAQNDTDPRPIVAKFRLHELKIILKKAGVKWGENDKSDQLTADNARILVSVNQIDISPYVGYDNRGYSYFITPDGGDLMEVTKKAEVDDANLKLPSPENKGKKFVMGNMGKAIG